MSRLQTVHSWSVHLLLMRPGKCFLATISLQLMYGTLHHPTGITGSVCQHLSLSPKLCKASSPEGLTIDWLLTAPAWIHHFFFLWGFLKDNIYRDNPGRTAALKKIRVVTQEECSRVTDTFSRRMQVCFQRAAYILNMWCNSRLLQIFRHCFPCNVEFTC